MPSIPVYAQLATRVYAAQQVNRTPTPTGWTELQWLPDTWNGFSAGVYQNGNDIVIAYTGTNGQKAADFGWANVLAATGAPSPQVIEAMLLYFQVKQANPTANITFTGHSLGGGIATMMGIFFNRPATVFDAAPLELGARNLVSLAYYKAVTSAAGYSDPAFDAYWAAAPTVFYQRESQIKNTFLKGEFLEYGRTALTEIGTSTAVNAGSPTNVSAFGELHSMTLLASMLASTSFASQVQARPKLISMLFDKSLYASNAESSSTPDFLTKIYSTQVKPTGSVPMMDNFATDLQKLGIDPAGLNQPAQDAIIAQGIEWYYWQSSNYAGQNFFIDNGQAGLLQYTSAVGAALPGALNKATTYTQKWLGEVYVAHGGAAGFPPFGTLFDQWSVATSSTAVTVTARDANKTQIYIGQGGGDTFTAGNAGDVILAGAGNDTLNSGNGYDLLCGGAGLDTYNWCVTHWEVDGTLMGGLARTDIERDAPNMPNLGINRADLTSGEENSASGIVLVSNSAIVKIAFSFSGPCYRSAFAGNTRVDGRGRKRCRRRNGQINLRWRSGVALRGFTCEA